MPFAPMPLAAQMISVLLAITGGDWLAITALMIGSSGLGGVITAFVGLRRLRVDASKVKADVSAQAQTVAIETAEGAMRVMGAAVSQLERDMQRQAKDHSDAMDALRHNHSRDMAHLRARLTDCETACQDCHDRLQELEP